MTCDRGSRLPIVGDTPSPESLLRAVSCLASRVVIRENQASSTGLARGGALFLEGLSMQIYDSVIEENRVAGAPGQGGALALDGASVRIERSTLARNRVDGPGDGGAIHQRGGFLIIGNATLGANEAAQGYGGAVAAFDGVETRIEGVTIADNLAAVGGGVVSIDDDATTFGADIIAGNLPENCFFDPPVNRPSRSNNIDSDGSCELDPEEDLIGVDPRLLPLADYGGRSDTYALDPASPAIDLNEFCGSAFLGQIFFEDQRRVPRPEEGCDAGAYEFLPIGERYDYRFALNDGQAGEGRFTLFEVGRFVDDLSRLGDWAENGPQLFLQYPPEVACRAFLSGRTDDGGDTYQGLWVCGDGSGVRGRFGASRVTSD